MARARKKDAKTDVVAQQLKISIAYGNLCEVSKGPSSRVFSGSFSRYLVAQSCYLTHATFKSIHFNFMTGTARPPAVTCFEYRIVILSLNI